MPKKTKYRKSHRGRRKGMSKGGNEVQKGEITKVIGVKKKSWQTSDYAKH